MFNYFLRTNAVQQLRKTSEKISVFCIRMKTTKEPFDNNCNEVQRPVKSVPNPFAREVLTYKATQQNVNSNENVAMSADEKEKRLKVLQLEVDIANQEGRRVPSLEYFKDHHWDYILTLPSTSARMKYYGYLWQIAIKKESKKRKKEKNAIDIEERVQKIRQERAENPHITYGLGHVSMFLRIYDSTINSFLNNRLIRAMQYSPKLVLDCSYDDLMTKREAENAAKQLVLCFAENRAHDDPFDLHYCNVNLSATCIKSLHRYVPTMLNPEFPMNIHHKCFTDIFPKEKLVYLTPHCRTDLLEYNPDDVYIIGAMVDTINNEPLSLAKAKKLGLRMARLPLDKYLQWGSGSGKSLTLNQVLHIMLDIKHFGDWPTALKHVPRRKVVDAIRSPEILKKRFKRHANAVNVDIRRLLNAKQ